MSVLLLSSYVGPQKHGKCHLHYTHQRTMPQNPEGSCTLHGKFVSLIQVLITLNMYTNILLLHRLIFYLREVLSTWCRLFGKRRQKRRTTVAICSSRVRLRNAINVYT